MNLNHFFSEDYQEARQRFVDAAQKAGATGASLQLEAWGPTGEGLAIDIAWLGSLRPQRVLVHTSGLHGVEGFAGSAIQLHALSEPPTLGSEEALVLVHALNPYGMAWLRRVNEANVDLNRNFPNPNQDWKGTARAYHQLNDLLNPPSPPSRGGFLVSATFQILRYGLTPLKQAVAAGQYDYPKGLFYGGAGLQKGPQCYLAWLSKNLAQVEYVLTLDVHTGIGPWARESLFLETPVCNRALKMFLKSRQHTKVPYFIQGGFSVALPRILPNTHLEALTQEFGTYPVLQILHALREENRWHHYGDGTLQHPAKHRLLEMFLPSSPTWRSAVLQQGRSLLEQAAKVLDGQPAKS
jgi:hypothetical protein